MPWVDKDQWTKAVDPGCIGRRIGRSQGGQQGNRITPTRYGAYFGKFPLTTPALPNGARQPDFDFPNSKFVYYAFANAVPFPNARNKAFGRLYDKVRQGPASLGVTFAEGRESFEMIANRLTQLHRGYRSLRRGRFKEFLKTFAVKPKRKHRNLVSNKVNQASSLWLEYSFGWSPLVNDVHSAMNALSQPVPAGERFKGSGSESYGFSTGSEIFSCRGRCHMGGRFSISNPNLYLLEQLGIANPALVIWELVPFSFMIDWVVDVGSFLGGWSAFYGCTVTDTWTTYSAKASIKVIWDPSHSLSGNGALIRRKVGIDFPTPNLSIRANIGSSLKRAANAASLLGQILTK